MPDWKHTRWMRIRLLAVTGFLVVCAGFVLYRVWTLQVRQADWLRELSRQQYLKDITLEPMRGPIVDRHGAPLAVSVMTESVFAMPGELEDPKAAARKLATALSLSPKRSRSLASQLSSRKHFTWVKRRLAPREVQKVRELELKGIHFAPESRRYYPARELAASIIGFAGDGQGLEGVELMYDGQLRGSTVLAQGLRDARGNLLFADGVGQHGAVRGGGVVLTIDSTIQEIVETVLEETTRDAGARAASAIVMDPVTGEILAIANMPTFNPNTYWKFKPSDFRNRAVTDCYEPGSTLKVFTMAAALGGGLIRKDEKIDCFRGNYPIGSHTIHDSHAGGFGNLTPAEILVHSSNIGMALIGQRLGRERLHEYLQQLGFGKRTEVDLPGESRCRLRKPDSWSEVGLATVSFGQGVSVTPLQLITALCAVANRGVWMRPLVVLEIRGPGDETLRRHDPDPAGRVMDPGDAEKLIRMMTGVTEKGGTGTRAAIAGFRVAGKTGTAQKVDPITGGYSKDKRVASFMGFVPAEAPRIAVLVVVDEPTSSPYGGVVAAPAFARIADATLRYLNVFPKSEDPSRLFALPSSGDDQADHVDPVEAIIEERIAEVDPIPKEEPVDGLPDLKGFSVREAVRVLAGLGLEAAVSGSGRVVGQEPRAGTARGSLHLVHLTLERREGPG